MQVQLKSALHHNGREYAVGSVVDPTELGMTDAQAADLLSGDAAAPFVVAPETVQAGVTELTEALAVANAENERLRERVAVLEAAQAVASPLADPEDRPRRRARSTTSDPAGAEVPSEVPKPEE